jgi:hypothetical protein
VLHRVPSQRLRCQLHGRFRRIPQMRETRKMTVAWSSMCRGGRERGRRLCLQELQRAGLWKTTKESGTTFYAFKTPPKLLRVGIFFRLGQWPRPAALSRAHARVDDDNDVEESSSIFRFILTRHASLNRFSTSRSPFQFVRGRQGMAWNGANQSYSKCPIFSCSSNYRSGIRKCPAQAMGSTRPWTQHSWYVFKVDAFTRLSL